MASQSFSRSIRAVATRRNLPYCIPRRAFTAALTSRPIGRTRASTIFAKAAQQKIRGIKTIDFAGSPETVYGMSNCIAALVVLKLMHPPPERADWPRDKLLVCAYVFEATS